MSFGIEEQTTEYASNDLVTPKDFGVFLPNNLKQKLIRTGTARSSLPTFESALGCVMIADISGFTKLGEKLRKKYGEGEVRRETGWLGYIPENQCMAIRSSLSSSHPRSY